MKKYRFLPFFFLLVLILGCKFPDNVPQLYELEKYRLEKINFGKTTVKEFELLTKFKAPPPSGQNIVFNTSGESEFQKIRVGFVNNKMDWIEFDFLNNISKADMIRLYGNPNGINTQYSRDFDYYEYGNFSFSAPKGEEYFVNLNLFGLPYQSLKNKATFLKSDNVRINPENIEVGKTVESDFRLLYPAIEPYSSQLNNSEYRISGNLILTPSVKQLYLKFSGGLLSWAGITPFTSVRSDNIIALKGQQFSVEKKQKYDFYIYNNVIVTASKDKKVINIGILDGKISPFLKIK
ncbi:MAG: hypothetical protein WCK67_00915 [bacterium]